MKILQISSAKTFGGGERHLVDLCRELDRRRHEVHVVLRPTSDWQSRLDFLPPERVVHASIRNAFGIFSAQKIARYAREHGIEIVHAHTARDYIPASLVSRLSSGAKFVLTRHVLFPMKPFHRLALRNLSTSIAVSSAVAANLRSIFPATKIVTIPNGISFNAIARQDRKKRREAFRFFHEIPFDAPLVVAIGELKPLKGQRDFVLAANEISKSNPDARFLIVGRDNTLANEFRRELKRLVKIFEMEDRVMFLDWVDDLPSLLTAADVFVSPSHSESFGLAMLEAMLAETPVVATATEGAKELFVDGESGMLVPVGDAVTIAKAVAKIIADQDLGDRLAARARRRAEADFSLEQMVDATEEVYRKALESRSES